MSSLISRLYNWVTDKANNVKVTASRHDGELDQIITALNRKVLCSASAPSSPIAGQSWVDTTNKYLKVYRNNEWVIMAPVHVGTSAMATPQEGDLWWDSTNNLLKAYNGSSWDTVLTSITSGGVIGSYKNLNVSRISATQVALTADELVLEDTNNKKVTIRSVSETIAITTSGASGLVASLSEASNTWYFIWVGRKSSDGTVNGFLSTSSSFTTVLGQVDSGYDQLCLVSSVRNDGSSNFVDFKQEGSRYNYAAWQTIGTGNVGTGSWTSIDISGYVPSALSTFCYGSLSGGGSGTAAAVTNDSSVSTAGTVDRNKIQDGAGSGEPAETTYWQFNVITANTLYWLSGGDTSPRLYLHGFELNKLV